MRIALATVILVLGITHVDGRPSGAPAEACDDMFPTGHYGISAQSTSNPYQLIVSATEYSAGSQITVTLNGMSNENFKGFLIQARSADGQTRYGTFINSGGDQQTSCSDEAVTHTGNNDKTTITVTWTAPAGLTGDIKFMATVVQEYDTFWTGLLSGTIMDVNSIEVSTEAAENSSASSLFTYLVYNLLALFWVFKLACRRFPTA